MGVARADCKKEDQQRIPGSALLLKQNSSKPGIPKLWSANHSATRTWDALLPNAFAEVLNWAAWAKYLSTGSTSNKYPYLVEVLAVPLWFHLSCSPGELPLWDAPISREVIRLMCEEVGLGLTSGCQGWYQGLRYARRGRKLGAWNIFGVLGRCVRIWYGLIEEEAIDACLALVHTHFSGTKHISLISLTKGESRMLRSRW